MNKEIVILMLFCITIILLSGCVQNRIDKDVSPAKDNLDCLRQCEREYFMGGLFCRVFQSDFRTIGADDCGKGGCAGFCECHALDCLIS